MNRILAHTSIIGTFSVATSSNTLFLIRNDGNVGIGANPIDYTKVFIDHTYSIEPPPSQFIVGTFLKTTATFSEKVHPLRVGIGELLEPYDIETNAPTFTSTIFSYFNATSSVGDNDTSLYGGVLYRTGDSKAFGLDVKIRGANKDSIGGRVNVGDAYGLNIGFQSTISGTSGTHYGMRNLVVADTEISYPKYGVFNSLGGDAYKNYGTYNSISCSGNVSQNYGTYNILNGENGVGTASFNFGVYNLLTSNYESENVGVYTYIGKPGDSGYLNVGHYIFIGSDDSTNVGLYINVESTAGTSQSAIIVNKGSSTFNEDQQPLSDFTIRSSGKSHMFHVDSTNDCIGIGTQSPAYDLEVAGGFKAKQIYIANGIDQILSESGDAVLGFGTGYEFNFTTDGGTGTKGRIQVSDTQSIFGNTYGLIESYTTAGYLTHDQKWIFGVGPNYIMEVNSSGVSASGLSVGTNSNYSGHLLPTEDSAYDLGSSTKKWRSLHVASGSIYIGGVTVSSSNGSIQIPSINLGTTENPVIITSQNNQVSFGPSTSTTFLTNVGMGTTGPSYSLHVVGTTSTTNLRITNGASSSFVLSSDSNGLASWTASYRSQMFSHGSFNPLDATTYYIGDIADLGPTTSNVVARRIKSQFTGSVISVTLLVAIGGTNGTNENTTFEIHNLTTATSSTITSTAQLTADFLTTYTLSTPLTVSANDDLQIRMICPTWVTNPTSVRGRFTARIKL